MKVDSRAFIGRRDSRCLEAFVGFAREVWGLSKKVDLEDGCEGRILVGRYGCAEGAHYLVRACGLGVPRRAADV